MFFPCVVAAAAAVATHSPAWFLSGAYHPPLPGKAGDERLHHAVSGTSTGSEISGEALTVALDVVQAWAVLLTLGFTLIIFFFLAFCVCSKKDDGYDEFEVSQGITTVKICHDGGENGVSFIPRIVGSGTESMKATDETSEASSRYTLKRELPAIPTSVGSEVRPNKSDRPISQHSSELYASVSDSAQGTSSFKLIGGVQVLPAGAIAPGGRAAVVKECVSSPEDRIDGASQKKEKISSEQTCPPYAQVKKSHPYSQVSKTEHPYAKVAPRKGQETDTDSYDEIKNIPKDPRKRETESKFPASEIRRNEKILPLTSSYGDSSKKESKVGTQKVTSPHSSNLVTSSHSSVPHSVPGRSPTSPPYRSPTSPPRAEEPAPIIPAAMAISGRTPANEEMPYMTPPILQPSRDQNQQHFSGDSQDSRGYTSISVREPLSALKARQGEGAIAALGRTSATKGPVQSQGSEGEGYYMTVSDDSADEMYACIYEGGSRGTGSETYAQIEPRTTPSSQAPPSVLSASSLPPSSPTGLSRSPQDPSPPAPPSVDSLRHVVHSRQASASSSASTGMGSPVAEKRGTRSPLPPLPQGDAMLYSPVEPPLSNQPAPKSPPKAISHVTDKPTPRSLEEMYAKVLKKPHGHIRGSSSGAVESSDSSVGASGRRGSAEIGEGLWTSKTSTTKTGPDMSHSMVESRAHDVSSGVNRAKSCDVSASWGGMSSEERKLKSGIVERNYESIPPLYSGSDPGYETVKNGDPPYASVDQTENYPGYETVRGSDMESEPGYETLKQKEIEPGYETVSEIASKQSLSSEPRYESMTTTEYEPGYETLSSKKSDPGYESVQEKDKIEYDPGYEELSHRSMGRTSSETDPNYEQLKFSSRRSSHEGDEGYEVVKKKDVVEGNYELVSDYDTQSDTADKSGVSIREQTSQPVPLYASVKKKESPKKEIPEPISQSKDEKINENFNVVNVTIDSSVETSAILKGIQEVTESRIEDIQKSTDIESPAVENEPKMDDREALKLVDIGKEPSNQTEKYLVMDSPEEVELPPPGGEDNHRISPPESPEEIKSPCEVDNQPPQVVTISLFDNFIKEPQSAVSLTFTEASPPVGSPDTGSARSSVSCDSNNKDSAAKAEPVEEKDEAVSSSDAKEEELIDFNVPSAPPPQFSNGQNEPSKESPLINSLEDPLPPPPLPVLDDDVATASPPPPPPPIPDEMCGLLHDLPPPPLDKEPIPAPEINGICGTSPIDDIPTSHVDTFPACAPSILQDLPPPLLPSDMEEKIENETDDGAHFKNGLNGSMTVTVNPMADMEETVSSSVASIPPVVASPQTAEATSVHPSPPIAPSGESGESQSSGSTVNGNGSVESVVTIDPKKGGDPSTTVPQDPSTVPPLQHSSSTSSSDSKHSDPHEGITPV